MSDNRDEFDYTTPLTIAKARIDALEAALHAAFMAMCAQRDNPDEEVFQDAIDALGLASSGVAQPVTATTQEAVAWQFRQRSAVGKGPQSQLPWGDWCGIEREDYERYIREPNPLIEVRPLFTGVAQPVAATPPDVQERIAELQYEAGMYQSLYDNSRNAALEEAALYHDGEAAHCRAIALCNLDNDLGIDSETHAIDHEIAAKDIREMKT